MSNWFTSIFSSGASKLVDSVGSAIDNLVTSDEERLELKNKLTAEIHDFKKSQLSHVESMEQQITDRHKADMVSDSWLSKNVRPLALVFLTCATVLLAYLTIFVDLSKLQLTSLEAWLPLLTNLLMLVYGFYFGSRGIEKIMQMKNNNNNKGR